MPESFTPALSLTTLAVPLPRMALFWIAIPAPVEETETPLVALPRPRALVAVVPMKLRSARATPPIVTFDAVSVTRMPSAVLRVMVLAATATFFVAPVTRMPTAFCKSSLPRIVVAVLPEASVALTRTPAVELLAITLPAPTALPAPAPAMSTPTALPRARRAELVPIRLPVIAALATLAPSRMPASVLLTIVLSVIVRPVIAFVAPTAVFWARMPNLLAATTPLVPVPKRLPWIVTPVMLALSAVGAISTAAPLENP